MSWPDLVTVANAPQAFEQEQLEDLEGVLWKSYFA
jgi:hypothetical protein